MSRRGAYVLLRALLSLAVAFIAAMQVRGAHKLFATDTARWWVFWTSIAAIVAINVLPALISALRHGSLRVRVGHTGAFEQDDARTLRRIAIENVGGASVDDVEVLVDSFEPQGAPFLPMPLLLMERKKQPVTLHRSRPLYVDLVAYDYGGAHPDHLILPYEDGNRPNLIPLRKRPYRLTVRVSGKDVAARVAHFGIDLDRDHRLLVWRQRFVRRPRLPSALRARRLPDSETPMPLLASLRTLARVEQLNAGEQGGFPRDLALAYVRQGLGEPSGPELEPKSERRLPEITREVERLISVALGISRDAERLRMGELSVDEAHTQWRRFDEFCREVRGFIDREVSTITAEWITLYGAGEGDAIPGREARALLYDLRNVATRVANRLREIRKNLPS